MERYYVQTTNESGDWINLFGPYEDENDAFNRLEEQNRISCGFMYRVYLEKTDDKYPISIIKCIRQYLDLDENDDSADIEINAMSNDEVFRIVCNWNGLIGYADKIKSWIGGVYRIDI